MNNPTINPNAPHVGDAYNTPTDVNANNNNNGNVQFTENQSLSLPEEQVNYSDLEQRMADLDGELDAVNQKIGDIKQKFAKYKTDFLAKQVDLHDIRRTAAGTATVDFQSNLSGAKAGIDKLVKDIRALKPLQNPNTPQEIKQYLPELVELREALWNLEDQLNNPLLALLLGAQYNESLGVWNQKISELADRLGENRENLVNYITCLVRAHHNLNVIAQNCESVLEHSEYRQAANFVEQGLIGIQAWYNERKAFVDEWQKLQARANEIVQEQENLLCKSSMEKA
ncbi:MAG: hypothetical protein K2L13_00455 [Opitutales bacterium]|nr:hypothetical protein [Opitutales bacterium]